MDDGQTLESRFESILVVDDDERTLNAFRRSRVGGARILTATTGVEALTLMNRHEPDLVILDLRLGNESGQDIMHSMKVARTSLPVVIMSGYLSVAATESLMREGASRVVFKPIALAEILQQLVRDRPLKISTDETPSLARAEWEHVQRVMHDCNGNISIAARRLGLRRTSLQRKLKKNPPAR